MDALLALDQGTSSSRALVFDRTGRLLASAQRELTQHYPQPGWVEHDAGEIWSGQLACAREALAATDAQVVAIGITNQRETTVLWDRKTGEPLHRALVWQDRRTAAFCETLKQQGAEPRVRELTGLVLDPYFSATKLRWLLDHVPGARERAARGELAFGTVDSWLLWQLSGGRVHATDPSNASRTLLFDIHRGDWSDELLGLFDIPRSLLPEVRPSAGGFGHASEFGLPITGIAGDQQAALFGQAALHPGQAKNTYGTGCFMLMNTGTSAAVSQNRLLTTPAYRLNGVTTYALEGSIFVAGAAVKWLRDGLGIITHASQTNDMATRIADNHGVYMVPAFVGLGAPHWRPDARAAIHGLTLDTSPAHLARAALEAVAYQSWDLLEAMAKDSGTTPAAMRVDGGMTANDWLCQFLADMLQIPVERPQNLETTAMGAAFHAGLATGVWNDLDDLARTWTGREPQQPAMAADQRETLLAGWHDALRRTLPD